MVHTEDNSVSWLFLKPAQARFPNHHVLPSNFKQLKSILCVCVFLFPSARPGSAEISPNNPMPSHIPILHILAQLPLGV